MTFKDLPQGLYTAKLTDWTLEEIPALDNKLKAVIELDIISPAQATPIKARYEGLLEKKDGTPNMKTLKTLVNCGYRGANIYDLAINGDALDKARDYEATVIKDEKGYTRIEWINLPGEMGSGLIKKKITRKANPALNKALADLMSAAPERESDEIPF